MPTLVLAYESTDQPGKRDQDLIEQTFPFGPPNKIWPHTPCGSICNIYGIGFF